MVSCLGFSCAFHCSRLLWRHYSRPIAVGPPYWRTICGLLSLLPCSFSVWRFVWLFPSQRSAFQSQLSAHYFAAPATAAAAAAAATRLPSLAQGRTPTRPGRLLPVSSVRALVRALVRLLCSVWRDSARSKFPTTRCHAPTPEQLVPSVVRNSWPSLAAPATPPNDRAVRFPATRNVLTSTLAKWFLLALRCSMPRCP